jgi:hypothetical protein
MTILIRNGVTDYEGVGIQSIAIPRISHLHSASNTRSATNLTTIPELQLSQQLHLADIPARERMIRVRQFGPALHSFVARPRRAPRPLVKSSNPSPRLAVFPE